MARRAKQTKQQHTGLFHAREARGMSRSELVRKSGVSKQQLSRLENGLIRLRLDHLKPFVNALGYTADQILLWGRYPGTGDHIESSDVLRDEGPGESIGPAPGQIPELDTRAGLGGGGVPAREVRKEGRHTDPVKSEGWVFPPSFIRDQLHTSASGLVVLDTHGDSMAPTVLSGERVVVDTGHKSPSPDGLYAIRDSFEGIVVKRLQLLRSAKPTRVKIISDNPNHATEEVPLAELEIVGKVLCCLKLF
ncbi:MAG TPA: LexA family transcriptional regulator [Xanthobacteraceae bacterium]|jgi:transcriptional regulator with XRE-family HTH domain|nr:LexA family transcriptional regulator [Xanthobacteraceae bacterium]